MEAAVVSNGQSTHRGQARIELTIAEIDHLGRRITAWLKGWRERDRRGQFKTQLGVLDSVVGEALQALRQQADSLRAGASPGQLYDDCRLCERRLLWIERVLWGYFREKFDQRTDPDLKGVLSAADEVVWSCYAEAFKNAADADAAVVRRAVPLSYIEPHFTPQAIPRDDPPGHLRDARLGGEFLKTYFAELPIPVVSLPPMCVQAPWWLVYLAHEVGHHVQHDLRPELGLVVAFANEVRAAAGTTSATRWQKWNQEIFADLFSVCMMGGSAAWAMAELETAPPDAMVISRSQYPAPIVRLRLLHAAVEALGPKEHVGAALPSPAIPDPLSEDIREALALAAPLAGELLRTPLSGLGTMMTLADWYADDYAVDGELDSWRSALRADTPLPARRTRRAARFITSAALAEYAALTGEEDDALRESARRRLAGRMLEAIELNQEEGTRSAETAPAADTPVVADRLTRTLLQVDPYG